MSTLPTTKITEVTEQETGLDTGRDFDAAVIVYNCDCHTYQQVIDLFCRYIPAMTSSKAFELAWRIDHHGNAQVYQGPRASTEKVAAHLANGGLRVAVR